MLRSKHDVVRETRREPTLSVKAGAKFWCRTKLKDDDSELNYTINCTTKKKTPINSLMDINALFNLGCRIILKTKSVLKCSEEESRYRFPQRSPSCLSH